MRGWKEHIFTAKKYQYISFLHIDNVNIHRKQGCVALTIRNKSKNIMTKK